MTPPRRAASASPDEIHRSDSCPFEEADGEKSFFNRSTALLVNFHLVTSDGANKNGGGSGGGAGRTMNPGGGVVTFDFWIRREKNRPGV
jgi:hypothetical protein